MTDRGLHVANFPVCLVLGLTACGGAEPAGEILSRFQLQLEAAKQQALAAGIPHVQSALLQGDPAQEILQRAKERDHDLIVMGTNGRRGMKRVFLGSVAAQVVRAATCPVLSVRAED